MAACDCCNDASAMHYSKRIKEMFPVPVPLPKLTAAIEHTSITFNPLTWAERRLGSFIHIHTPNTTSYYIHIHIQTHNTTSSCRAHTYTDPKCNQITRQIHIQIHNTINSYKANTYTDPKYKQFLQGKYIYRLTIQSIPTKANTYTDP